MHFRKILCASALIFTSVGASLSPAQASVNGWNSSEGSVVKLWAKGYKASDRLCSGTHIGNGWVLTAEHCLSVVGINPSTSHAVWGDYSIKWDAEGFSGNVAKIDRVVPMPDSSKDMALVHSAQLVNAPSARLRDGGQAEDLLNAQCTAFGYGLWEDNFHSDAALAKHQRGVNFTIIEAHTDIKDSPNAQLRGRGENSGALLTGDSGGGLFCNGVLSGVTVGYTEHSHTNTFMSVSAPERRWILTVTGI